MFLTFYFISFIKVDYIKLGKIISGEKNIKKKRKEKSCIIPLSKAIIVTTFISVHNEKWTFFFFPFLSSFPNPLLDIMEASPRITLFMSNYSKVFHF